MRIATLILFTVVAAAVAYFIGYKTVHDGAVTTISKTPDYENAKVGDVVRVIGNNITLEELVRESHQEALPGQHGIVEARLSGINPMALKVWLHGDGQELGGEVTVMGTVWDKSFVLGTPVIVLDNWRMESRTQRSAR